MGVVTVLISRRTSRGWRWRQQSAWWGRTVICHCADRVCLVRWFGRFVCYVRGGGEIKMSRFVEAVSLSKWPKKGSCKAQQGVVQQEGESKAC